MTRLRLSYEDEEELDKIIDKQVEEIKEAQKNIVAYLSEQGEKVDTIEDNILKTEFNKIEAENDLKIVRKNKINRLTLVLSTVALGSIMGLSVGPIGIIPGMALGGYFGSHINSLY